MLEIKELKTELFSKEFYMFFSPKENSVICKGNSRVFFIALEVFLLTNKMLAFFPERLYKMTYLFLKKCKFFTHKRLSYMYTFCYISC